MSRIHSLMEIPLVRLGIILFLVMLLFSVLPGCATVPNDGSGRAAVSRIALQTVTTVAVSRVIERDNATAAEKQKRAQRIVSVAVALQNAGDDALASLPAITQALAPLLDKADLNPLERAQADILARELVLAALEQTDASKYLATVNLLLADVIRIASYYLPAASPTGLLWRPERMYDPCRELELSNCSPLTS